MSSLEAAIYNEARKARSAAELALSPKLSTPFFTSGTWTAPQDGILEMRAMGAGGSGANRGSGTGVGTGGYSGAWGAKIVRVSKGEVVSVSVGAGGPSSGGVGPSPGAAGGTTTITHNSITRTAPGGLAGVYAASGTPSVPNGPSLPVGDWDIGAASVKPGMVASGSTGGAGVDINALGGNLTTSASSNASGGGGTGGPSIGALGGGATPDGKAADGQSPTAAGIYLVAGDEQWLISFYGGSGGAGAGANGLGGNGGGGAGNISSGLPGDGGNGGGGGSSINAVGGKGGRGGGGGASVSGVLPGAGGNGYACLHFYPDMGV